MRKNQIISTGIFFVFCCFALFGVSFVGHVIEKPRDFPVDTLEIFSDTDTDGIVDNLDIVLGARNEVERSPIYKSTYYKGGYPPESEGVCSDVIWRALKDAGFSLKEALDSDIASHPKKYPRVQMKPDPNIDFRRVENLKVFFDNFAESLTLKIVPRNRENLSMWQPGDIVIFGAPHWHIAIISDKRNSDGIPYIIHNASPTPREDDWLILWNEKLSSIVGHYRLKYSFLGK